jgi:hypothetical protein
VRMIRVQCVQTRVAIEGVHPILHFIDFLQFRLSHQLQLNKTDFFQVLVTAIKQLYANSLI